MRVKIEIKDKTFYSAEEAIAANKRIFGKDAKVQVLPDSDSPEDHIYFGLANLITVDQLDIFFEFAPHGYPDKLEQLKAQTMNKVEKILDQVIKANEDRVMDDST